MFRSLFLGVVCAGLMIGAAQARTARAASAEPVAETGEGGVRPVSVVVPESAPVCTHTRRRLWLEGEGWVVRKIPQCR